MWFDGCAGYLDGPGRRLESPKKDEDGIKISLSEVAGSDYKAYQGVTLMKTTMAKLRALQEDVSGACAWIHECKTQKLLKHEGEQSWTYTQFNTPWPVTPA